MHGQWPLVGGGERSVLAQSMKKWKQRRWAGGATQGSVWNPSSREASQVMELRREGRCWTGWKADTGQAGARQVGKQVLNSLAGRCWTSWQAGAGQVGRQVLAGRKADAGQVGRQVLERWAGGSQGKGNTRHGQAWRFLWVSSYLFHPEVEWDLERGWMEAGWVNAAKKVQGTRQDTRCYVTANVLRPESSSHGINNNRTCLGWEQWLTNWGLAISNGLASPPRNEGVILQ